MLYITKFKRRPRRSYAALLTHLRQAWQIKELDDKEAFLRFGTTSLTALPGRSLRLGVWNMCKGSGGVLFEHDFRVMCFRCDLFLTQEALISPRSLTTFQQPGIELMHAASYMRQDGLRDGVMTLSRVAAADSPMRIVCKFPEPVFKTPKVALVTTYPIADHPDPLMVINLHATLIRRTNIAVEEMEFLISQIPAHKGPIILGGDFNTFTPMYLRAITDTLARIGLERVPLAEEKRSMLSSLDHVFVKGLRVTKAWIATTFQSSDHFPLFLELHIAA
ncbi:MAG: endonuclease/exonuclease/phosphatase family protein [Oligoflexales bacterium]